MKVEDLLTMYAPYVGVGFLLGCLPMLAGIGIQVVINIFKKYDLEENFMTMKERFENKVAVARCAVAGVAVSAPLALCTITSFAEEPASADPLITACTSIASSATTAINGVIPIALPLVGAGLVVTIGLKVFKRIAGKA